MGSGVGDLKLTTPMNAELGSGRRLEYRQKKIMWALRGASVQSFPQRNHADFGVGGLKFIRSNSYVVLGVGVF